MQVWGYDLLGGPLLPQTPMKRGLRNENLGLTWQIPQSVLVLASCMTCELLGLVPCLGLIPQSLCQLLFCTDGKLGVQVGGMNTIRASGAVSSAGSVEALCALKATSLGWLGIYLQWGSQGALSILVYVLAWCAALGTVVFSSWSGLLCWAVGHHLTHLLPVAWDVLGTIRRFSGCQRSWNHMGLVHCAVSVFLGRFCLSADIVESEWVTAMVPSGIALGGTSEIKASISCDLVFFKCIMTKWSQFADFNAIYWQMFPALQSRSPQLAPCSNMNYAYASAILITQSCILCGSILFIS